MTLVAVSAAYGAGGSRIAPALAERLAVPFLDRAIPLEAAGRLSSGNDAEADDDAAEERFLDRLLRGFVGIDAGSPTPALTGDPVTEDVQRQIEDALFQRAASGEGVILGRGAVAVLREDPRALRVRLTGPAAARAARAAALAGIEVGEAERRRRRLDRAHADYLRRFYGVDVDDLALYHIVLDTTEVPYDTAVDVLARAAAAF